MFRAAVEAVAGLDRTRVLEGVRSICIHGALVALAVPVVADEQPEEESTTLPPGVANGSYLETALPPTETRGPTLAESEVPPTGPPAQEQGEIEARPSKQPTDLAEIALPTTLAALPVPREQPFGAAPEVPLPPIAIEVPDRAEAVADDSEALPDESAAAVDESETETAPARDEALRARVLQPILLGLGPRERVAPTNEAGPLPDEADSGPASWGPPVLAESANEFGAAPLHLLGSEVAPGTRERLYWTTGQSFSGNSMETPVMVLHGSKPGPRLCLTAGVHGDELNGIEVVRRLAYKIDPEQLTGTVIAVPIVNLLGFSRGSRYLPDRRDLNRFFPGNRRGSSASRIADSFFASVITGCEALIDIHTGSLNRANLPQVRGDLTDPRVLEFTRGFGATAVLHSPGEPGMLRHAASRSGIPAVTIEIGGPQRLQPEEIEHGVQAIETLLNKVSMIEQPRRWREPQAVYYDSRWVRVDDGGMLFTEVGLGDRVSGGQVLGRVIDPVSNRSTEVLAPEDGRVLGIALNQLVLPGFAAFNIGIAASEEIVVEAILEAGPDDERYLENDHLEQEPPARPEEPGPGDAEAHELHPEEYPEE